MIPDSRQLAKELGSKRYNNGKKCRNGHLSDRLTSTGQCCQCKADYQAKLRKDDPESLRAIEREYYDRNRESCKKRVNNRYHDVYKHDEEWVERKRKYNRDYNKANWEWLYEKSRYHRYSNAAARRAQSKLATLPGYEEEIRAIYKNRPDGYHVDHMVPLNGENVCGLHVPWNLQYLLAEENLAKSNKIDS